MEMTPLKMMLMLCCTLLTACVTPPGPGAKEGETPPWLLSHQSMKIWGNAGSFGPVPAEQADLAAQTCATLNTKEASFEATGYHSRAKGLDGKALPDGGFFCVRE
jgi:hypothetical protein